MSTKRRHRIERHEMENVVHVSPERPEGATANQPRELHHFPSTRRVHLGDTEARRRFLYRVLNRGSDLHLNSILGPDAVDE